MALITFSASGTIKSADVNANFSICVLTDTSKTITVTHTWSAAQSFAAGSVSLPSIYLSTDTTSGLYRIGANNYGFAISAAKVLDISATGLGITGLCDLSAATSGQIKFPATQNASSNANTLDDYEEGTFTATVGVTGGSVTLTSGDSGDLCTYIKIGGLVFVSGLLTAASVSSPSGQCDIGGLPFTAANNGRNNAGVSYFANTMNSATAGAYEGFVAQGTTTMRFARFSAGAQVDSAADWKAGSNVKFAAVYSVV